jgi:hypothetical protein
VKGQRQGARNGGYGKGGGWRISAPTVKFGGMVGYPDDADGDAMERVATSSDLSRPMLVDFAVSVPSAAAASEVGKRAGARGYSVEVAQEDESWTVYCSVEMLLVHADLLRRQAELHALAADLGGHADGWGTIGNSLAS